jgi:hypothetical protein
MDPDPERKSKKAFMWIQNTERLFLENFIPGVSEEVVDLSGVVVVLACLFYLFGRLCCSL